MRKIDMDVLRRLHEAGRGTGGIASRDGQQFCIKIWEQFPEIYQISKSLSLREHLFGTVLTNIGKMSPKEAHESASGAARCVLEDVKNKVVA